MTIYSRQQNHARALAIGYAKFCECSLLFLIFSSVRVVDNEIKKNVTRGQVIQPAECDDTKARNHLKT